MDTKAVNNCWARVDKDHGEGDGTYKIIYESNQSDVPQTAVIEVVSEDGTIVKEISITQSPRRVYLSAMKQKVFTKNDCMADQNGTDVLYVVPSGKYTSYISQEDADAQAERDLNENGQDYANAEGTCKTYIWYNDEMSVTKTKNDCACGATGSEVTYTVRAGKYDSLVSKDDANRKAQEDLDENAQKYANDNGTCSELYYSKRVEGDFMKNNCPSGQVPSAPIHYVVEAGAFTSAISQADADAKAEAELQSKGQAKANAEGTCSTVYWNVEKSGFFKKNDCEEGVGSVVVYRVPANTISSTISQADADAKAAQKVQEEGQAYANEHGTCFSTTTYSSKEVKVTLKKNDCEEGSEGSEVEYVVEAGKYTSTISQEDADAKAEKDASDNAQAYANEHGTCIPSTVYRSKEIRTTLTRNNCTEGVGSEATYVVPEGKYTSTVSQKDADDQAQADSDANAQNWVNENAECVLHFVNVEKSQSFNKNDCEEGMKGTAVVYTVEAGKYESTISQADADAKAQAEIDANGQAYANEHGSCVDVYLSQEIREKVQKNDCDSGMVGTEVEYVVEAGKYTSDISQEDADRQAQEDFDENAQSYANKNGTCLYVNVRKSQTFTRNNCVDGGIGSEVEYVVEAGTYTSAESQAAADALADADIAANGQNYANEHGTCSEVYKNVEMSQDFQKNDCGSGMKGSIVTYTVPAGKYASIVSQEDANAKAQDEIDENGQDYANENGECVDIFLSKEIREEVQKNDCEGGMVGTTVEYVVEAGKYNSEESQEAADALAQADFDENAQAYANKNGHCVYANVEKKQTFTRDNCGEGYEGTEVEYVVPAGKYTSEESQEAADALADADIAANGQNNANQEGECLQIFYNVEKSQQFTPECSEGQIADPYTYTVSAGKYQSTVSQEDADAKADADIAENGQREANENSECRDLYLSVEKKGTFYRDNCGSCHHGTAYEYICEAGKYTSSISQADADAQAQADVDANGQAAANKNGSCVADSAISTWTDTGNTRCDGCTSKKEQTDTNPCSSSYNTTKWVAGGGRDCTENGSWGKWSSWSCDGCTDTRHRDNSCGGREYDYNYNYSGCGSWEDQSWDGDCDGTYYIIYERNSCSGKVRVSHKGQQEGRCGYVCDMTLNSGSTRPDVSYSGGSDSVSGTSVGGSSVTVSSSQSWCSPSVSQKLGDSNFLVIAECDANPTYSRRSAIVTVKNSCKTMNFSVNQKAKADDYVFTFANGSTDTKVWSGSADAQSIQYTVSSTKNGSYIGYSVGSKPNWCTVNINSPSGTSALAVISMTANTGTSSRSGTITLTQNESGKTVTISVEQAGVTKVPCEITGTISKLLNSLNANELSISFSFVETNNDCTGGDKWVQVTLTGCSYISGGNNTVVQSGTSNEVFDLKVTGAVRQWILVNLYDGYTTDNIMIQVQGSTRGGGQCCTCYVNMTGGNI